MVGPVPLLMGMALGVRLTSSLPQASARLGLIGLLLIALLTGCHGVPRNDLLALSLWLSLKSSLLGLLHC